MELSVGSQEGTLVLSSPNAIYLDQLEASGGEKLKMIEQVIRDETGISARILTKDRAPEKKPEVDLDQLISSIHTDVTIE